MIQPRAILKKVYDYIENNCYFRSAFSEINYNTNKWGQNNELSYIEELSEEPNTVLLWCWKSWLYMIFLTLTVWLRFEPVALETTEVFEQNNQGAFEGDCQTNVGFRRWLQGILSTEKKKIGRAER